MITCVKDDVSREYTIVMGRYCVRRVAYSLTQSSAEVNRILYRLLNKMTWDSDACLRSCPSTPPNKRILAQLILAIEGVDKPGAKQIMEGSVLA